MQLSASACSRCVSAKRFIRRSVCVCLELSFVCSLFWAIFLCGIKFSEARFSLHYKLRNWLEMYEYTHATGFERSLSLSLLSLFAPLSSASESLSSSPPWAFSAYVCVCVCVYLKHEPRRRSIFRNKLKDFLLQYKCVPHPLFKRWRGGSFAPYLNTINSFGHAVLCAIASLYARLWSFHPGTPPSPH